LVYISQEYPRVYRYTENINLEMEMRAGGPAGGAFQTDYITDGNFFFGVNKYFVWA